MEDFQTKTGMKSDKKCNVLEFLEETERKYPDRTAVDDGTFCLSWRELKDLSQRMGTLFCEICDQGEPVVILAEKSARTLAAMFGVVYAGCFYVMVDPSQPAARVREILKILEPQLVVLNNENEMLLDEAGYTKRKYILRERSRYRAFAADTPAESWYRFVVWDFYIRVDGNTEGNSSQPSGSD